MSAFEENIAAIDRAREAEYAVKREMVMALLACAEFLDNYTDAETDPDTGRTIPNEAMRLLNDVEAVLRKAGIKW